LVGKYERKKSNKSNKEDFSGMILGPYSGAGLKSKYIEQWLADALPKPLEQFEIDRRSLEWNGCNEA